MKLSIKNMVCDRCKLIVQNICDQLGLAPAEIKLGEVSFAQPLSEQQKTAFEQALAETGLFLLDDGKHKLIEQIKQACLAYLQTQSHAQTMTLSKYIAANVNKEYRYISRLFTSVESVSLEQYYIMLRIEKVKEWITYEQLSFAEIAHDMGFSSVAHMSRQFKKVTGLTLSEFREQADTSRRVPLDKVKNLQH